MTQAQKTLGMAALGLVVVLAIGALILHNRKAGGTSQPGLQAAIATALDKQSHAQSRNILRNIYQARADTPVWLTPSGPSDDAHAVMTLLDRADSQGLAPPRYAYAPVPGSGANDTDRAAFEMRLTEAAYAYAHDMAQGMLKPAKLFDDVSLAARHDDTLSNFEQAAGQGTVADYLQSLEPGNPAYRALKTALARYRGLVVHPWGTLSANAGKDTLAARLAAEGYLDTQDASPDQLRQALKSYQTANGLATSGRLDAKTLEMLNVPAGNRVQQIQANMERWRWLPRDLGPRYIMVNVPGASLAMVDNGGVIITSRVVVGAPDKPTPILTTQAVAVTVNPVWHIPKSIVEKEIKPKLEENPDYLDAKNMEETPDGGLVQKPGPSNALGAVKFEMPNIFDVYLHDTPGKQAFLSDDRALSHGCVRVEQIAALTEQLAGIDDAALTQMVGTGDTIRKPIKPPVPVYILYWTAIANDDGTIGFRPDIYDRDAKMIAAMHGTRAPRLASTKG